VAHCQVRVLGWLIESATAVPVPCSGTSPVPAQPSQTRRMPAAAGMAAGADAVKATEAITVLVP